MPRTKKTTEEEVKDTETASGSDVENTLKPNKTKSITFKVRNPNVKGGIGTRTFSAETHGDKFEELAEMFAETNKHLIIE